MVDVLLATYNGEKYIREQLDSILSQTYQDFKILIRDDGSSDSTLSIIEEYKKQYPNKIYLKQDDVKCGSSAKNFFQLTRYATSNYVMYADQDDFWLPNKIEITLNKMLEIEKENGENTPTLVFTTYKAVGETLQDLEVNESKTQIAAYNLELNRLLVQNYVTGCLMMVNRALYCNMGEFDERILMHDWWAALYASANGVICHVPNIVMLYRQHGNNCVGVVEIKSMKYRIRKILDKDTKNAQYYYRNQAECFYERYKEQLDDTICNTLEEFLSIYETKSKVKRIKKLLKGKFLKSDSVRILGQLWYI